MTIRNICIRTDTSKKETNILAGRPIKAKRNPAPSMLDDKKYITKAKKTIKNHQILAATRNHKNKGICFIFILMCLFKIASNTQTQHHKTYDKKQ